MKTHEIELGVRRWFEEAINLPERFSDRVQIHWAGEAYTDNQLAVIEPRMRGFERTGPRDGDMEIMVLETTVWLKQDPGSPAFGLLSMLVDEARRLVDSTRRDEDGGPGAVSKVYNRDGLPYAALDFGPAQERRAENQTVQIGGVAVKGVDLAVLTSRVLISPLKPRVSARR